MPDISMCEGGDCPMKERCYRYRAIPTPEWQAYFVEPPWRDTVDGPKCDYFWRIEPGHKVKEEK